jgi:hypothetical protein
MLCIPDLNNQTMASKEPARSVCARIFHRLFRPGETIDGAAPPRVDVVFSDSE